MAGGVKFVHEGIFLKVAAPGRVYSDDVHAQKAVSSELRHLNVLDNKCQYGSAMQELKDSAPRKYVELKEPRLETAAEKMRKS